MYFSILKTYLNMRQVFSLLLLTISLCITPTSIYAKIWRLNNNGNAPLPAIQANFTGTLQAAHDNASVVSGDTLHVEQSPTTYGPCIFSKRLILIGPGYFLSNNPNTQVNTSWGSTVGDLTIKNVNSAGSQIWGLTCGTVNAGQNNLVIGRCYFPGTQIFIGSTDNSNLNNIKIQQNYFICPGSAWGINPATGTGDVTNVGIYNNLMTHSAGAARGIYLTTKFSGIIKNNVVVSSFEPFSVANFYILNNIIYSTSNVGSTFNNCNVEYNRATNLNTLSTASGTGNTYGMGNVVNSVAQIAWVTGSSPDNNLNITPSSVCVDAGKLGVDCGAFEGDYPYKLSGIPPVPNIYSLSIAPIASGASSMTVTVSAKGNN
jgi:hypothetical protein